ncbi:MAG: 2-keto-4-pentenoate hydratase, partial [Micromonospora sp.]
MTDGTPDPVAAAYRRLRIAAQTRTPCPPVRDLIGPDDETLAYAVQHRLTEARIRDGGRPVGRKVGLTSAAVQRQLGVDRPDFGMLFEDMACAESGAISLDRLLQPRVEAEVAFVLADDVTDPGVT